MEYFYVIFVIAVFTVLGVSYKLSDHLKCNQPQVNFFMFLSGLVVILAWIWKTGSLAPTPAIAALGAVLGVNAFINVRAFRDASTKGRISTSFTILQLSLVIPVLASILIWHEAPDLKRYAGLALTAAAIVLLGIDMRKCEE